VSDVSSHLSVEEVLDAVALEEEFDRIAAMSDDAVRAELASYRYDAGRMEAKVQDAIRRTLGESALEALSTPSEPPAPPAKVVPIRKARGLSWVEGTRWAPLAAAALVLLTLGTGGSLFAARTMPAPTVAYRTYVPPPTPEQIARVARREAYADCEAGYYGEAWDRLDLARGLDENGEASPEVKQARQEIADYYAGKKPHHSGHLNDAKGPLHFNERPLQIHP
jgi:hypothetical protein